MPVRYIGHFANVGVQVVESRVRLRRLGGAFVKRINLWRNCQLPRSLPHRLQVVAAEIIMRLTRRLIALTEQNRRQIPAVDDGLRRHSAARDRHKGRQQVNCAGDHIADGFRLDSARPPGNRRLADSAFPGAALAAAERLRAAAVGPFDEPGPVVAGKDDQCVVGDLQFTQSVQHLPDAPVHLLDPVAVTAVGGLAAELSPLDESVREPPCAADTGRTACPCWHG